MVGPIDQPEDAGVGGGSGRGNEGGMRMYGGGGWGLTSGDKVGGRRRHAGLAVAYTPRHKLAWLHVAHNIKRHQSAQALTERLLCRPAAYAGASRL